MNSNWEIVNIPMIFIVSCNSSVDTTFNAIQVGLTPILDPVFSLPYVPYLTKFTLKTLNNVIGLTSAITNFRIFHICPRDGNGFCMGQHWSIFASLCPSA